MIIGISGKAGSGKNALANCITHIDNTWMHKSFASKLKIICYTLIGGRFFDQVSEAGKAKYLPEWNMTIGEMQQRVGTDAIRNVIHKNAWVMALFADYRDGDKWIITDVRFENEAQAILDRGGFLVRIDGARIEDTGRDPQHISETELDDWQKWHYRFDNSTLDIDDLQDHAQQILKLVYGDK
jgi:hypothetical protein